MVRPLEHHLTIIIRALSPTTQYQAHSGVLTQECFVTIDEMPVEAVVRAGILPGDTFGVVATGFAMIALLLDVFATGSIRF